MDKLFETLRNGDLKYLVSDTISIDQYSSKQSVDNITVGFFIADKSAGKDLYDVISRVFIDEFKDIDLSNNLTKNDDYPLFIELDRNKYFYNTLSDMVEIIGRLADVKKWYFRGEDNEKRELTKDNIVSNIRLTKMKFNDIENPSRPSKKVDEKELKEFLETGSYRKNGKIITIEDAYDRYDWQIEKFITEAEMEMELARANETGTPTYLTLIEAFPYHQFIETEDKLFLQRDDKILMLKYLD